MNSELTCSDCRNVFFGSSVFGNGSGVCNICRASREANERSDREMAQRERLARQNQPVKPFSHDDYSSSDMSFGGDGSPLIILVLSMIGVSWLFHVLLNLDFNFMLLFFTCPIGAVVALVVKSWFE